MGTPSPCYLEKGIFIFLIYDDINEKFYVHYDVLKRHHFFILLFSLNHKKKRLNPKNPQK